MICLKLTICHLNHQNIQQKQVLGTWHKDERKRLCRQQRVLKDLKIESSKIKDKFEKKNISTTNRTIAMVYWCLMIWYNFLDLSIDYGLYYCQKDFFLFFLLFFLFLFLRILNLCLLSVEMKQIVKRNEQNKYNKSIWIKI